MARVLIRNAKGGATREIDDRALPYFQGWVIIDTLDDSNDASPLYLSKSESDFRYARKADLDAAAIGNYDPMPLFGQVIASDGTTGDQTAKINAALQAAVAAGHRGVVTLIGTFYVTTLVVPSNCTMDCNNATIIQITGNSSNMLRTSAHAPLRSVADAAVTAAGTTVTSASAAFTSADVGRNVFIAGAGTAAGSGGQTGLYTTIASVTSATQAVLTDVAITTVSGASLKVYTRAQNITIRGGLWDHGNTNTSGTAAGSDMHSICMRRVDHLTLTGMTVQGATNFAHTLDVGDVTDFLIEDIRTGPGTIKTSDYVHVNGPATRGVIRRISGASADDFVALTAMDYAGYSDVYGPITDIDIEDISGTPTTALVKLSGSKEAGAYLDRIHIRNAVRLGTDTGVNAFYALECLSDCGTLDLRNVTLEGSNGRVLLQAGQNANLPGFIKSLTIDASRYVPPTKSFPLVNSVGMTMETLTIRGMTQTLAAGSAGPLVQLDSAGGGTIMPSINVVNISDVNWPGNTGTNLLNMIVAGTVGALKLSNVRFTNAVGAGGALVLANVAGTTLTDVFLSNVDFQAGWLADINCATTFWLDGVKGTVSNGTFRIRAAGAPTVRGAGISMSSTGMTIDAGGTVRSLSSDFACDVSKLTKTAGDRATNTNSAVAGGVGPVVSDGTVWRNLATGLSA